MRPSQSGKLNIKPRINKEIIAIRFNRNTILLETLIKDLVYKGIIIPLPKDRAHNTKLNTILEENNKKKKNSSAAKSKDDIFNILTALEKYINFATIVEENKDGLYF